MAIPKADRTHNDDQEKLEVAREAILDLLDDGQYPIVTVPREALAEILKHGLTPRASAYLKNVKVIAGTLGREPFLPPGDDRVVLEIHVNRSKIVPRFTGPKKEFDGVVAITGGAEPAEIRVLEMKKSG